MNKKFINKDREILSIKISAIKGPMDNRSTMKREKIGDIIIPLYRKSDISQFNEGRFEMNFIHRNEESPVKLDFEIHKYFKFEETFTPEELAERKRQLELA